MAQTRQEYQKAVELAEAGHYGAALEQMQGYLRQRPDDGEALNDAGTILFCMHRGQEAIEHYIRSLAVCTGDKRMQVCWNLFEAYLGEHQPEKALVLLEPLAAGGLLNADVLNRLGREFLEQGALGLTIEMLLNSLAISPGQEVLGPMIEIIRSRRMKVGLIGSTGRVPTGLPEYLAVRYPLRAAGSEMHENILQWCETAVFAGAEQIPAYAVSCPKIVLIGPEDLTGPQTELIGRVKADAMIFADRNCLEIYEEKFGLPQGPYCISDILYGVDPMAVEFRDKPKGKKLAAIGPWDAHYNPMFLMHCMQKLHYLDPDARLYLAGDFEDASVKRHIEKLIETMDLESTVFLDGNPKNLCRWLKEKHYIVSTAVDGRGLPGVFAGMAAGLRPVVAVFPGAEEFINLENIFKLAEDFCRQVLDGDYLPQDYRRQVEAKFAGGKGFAGLDRILQQVENMLPAGVTGNAAKNVPADSCVFKPQANMHEEQSVEEMARKALQAARQLSDTSDAEFTEAEAVST